jgi:microsomal epoxide hydrolase
LAAGAATQEQPESGFFTTSDGVRLHYLEAGSGPAIVFVPGWTMPAWIWEAQIRHFAAEHHVVALDPRSQGASGRPNHGNSTDRRAQDVHELVQKLKLGPAVLVGWSLAVPELLTYAEKFGGGDVRGYVLVDGFAWAHRDPRFTDSMLSFYPQMEGEGRRDFTEAFVRSMYKKPQSEDYIRRVIEASLSTPADAAVAMSVTAAGRDDWRPAMAKLDRPVM